MHDKSHRLTNIGSMDILCPLRQAQDKGYGIVETLIVLIILSVLVVIVIGKYEVVTREAKEAALKSELVNIRMSITLFKIRNDRYPKDLKELIEKKVMDPYRKDFIIKGSYLEPYSLDKAGNVVDPFDVPYAYDPKTGRVWSQKKGFENW